MDEMKVDVTKIRITADYPVPDRGAIKVLQQDIQAVGLMTPIELLGPDMMTGTYQLKDGRKRLAAVMRLGLTTIPARVMPLPPGKQVEGGRMRGDGRFQPPRRGSSLRIDTLQRQQVLRDLEAEHRREQALPLLKRGVPVSEIAERLNCASSTIYNDRKILVDSGLLPKPESRNSSVRGTTGHGQTLRVLTNAATMLDGVAASLDNLHPEDLMLIDHGEWEVSFKDAIRAMNRVRRSVGNGSDDNHD